MGLAIYSKAHEDYVVDERHPLTFTFDGRIGGTIDRQVFLHNDNPERYFTDITVQAIDLDPSLQDLTNNMRSGYYWKLAQKDIALTNTEWLTVGIANILTMSRDLGTNSKADIATYLPIWVRVSVPRNQAITTVKTIVLRIQATEIVVDG